MRTPRTTTIAALAAICLAAPAGLRAGPGTETTEPGAVSDSIRSYEAPTGDERRREYLRQAFLSPGAFFRIAGPASGMHLGDEPQEWGQGASGLGKRLASRFAEVQLQTAAHHGIAAAAGYETRYERCDCGGAAKRIGHAVSRIFVTRNREGALRPNFPLIGSYYAANMISMTWHPDRYSPWKEGLRGGHVQVGMQAAFNIAREFGPELKRLFRFGT